MSDTVTTKDGVRIFFKDWGPKDAQPIVFHHGWPLSSDDWDTQMLFFLEQGLSRRRQRPARPRALRAGERRPRHGPLRGRCLGRRRASRPSRTPIHIGHSTGGGEVARYVAKYGQPQGRVAKAVLVSSVPPLMVKTANNPGGTPIEVFDGFRAGARRQPRPVLHRRRVGPLLRLQPAGREGLAGRDRQLVAPGHDGQRQGALRGHQGLLRDRPDRRPQGDHRADAGARRATTTRSCPTPMPACFRPSC